MEYAPLLKEGQFTIVSVTFLTTAYMAHYVLRLEGLIRKELIAHNNCDRHVKIWHVLFPGWWLVTTAAILGAVRILLSPWFEHFLLDMAVLVLMTVGYVSFAVVAGMSWKWNSWGSLKQPSATKISK